MQILSSYPSAASQSDKTQTEVNKTTTANASTSTDKNTEAANTDTANQFSSRAEKFSQLNREFDITASGFKITSAFINRLAELNIISSSEASNLSSDLSPETEATDSLSQLKSAMDALVKRVQGETGTEGLIAILEKPQQILENLDGSVRKESPTAPATAAAELDSYLKSDAANILSDKEKSTLKDLKIALNIADKLNPEQRTSAEVSKYMQILKRYG
ncbi:MAG: hypothetical protein OFPI_15190 [Osedax symbiont Rs2]|nr:MAG: hypothetical protein OFPI_15190 [Osedax symbiont Rs2]